MPLVKREGRPIDGDEFPQAKACPFCGGDMQKMAVYCDNEDPALRHWGITFYRIYCAGCLSSGAAKGSQQLAFEAWNQREKEST